MKVLMTWCSKPLKIQGEKNIKDLVLPCSSIYRSLEGGPDLSFPLKSWGSVPKFFPFWAQLRLCEGHITFPPYPFPFERFVFSGGEEGRIREGRWGSTAPPPTRGAPHAPPHPRGVPPFCKQSGIEHCLTSTMRCNFPSISWDWHNFQNKKEKSVQQLIFTSWTMQESVTKKTESTCL